MIVTPSEMRAIEEQAFANGSTAESLTDAVGLRIAERLDQIVGHESALVVFYAGKGNNAGDALVAAARLREMAIGRGEHLRIGLRLAFEDPASLGELPRRKLGALPADEVQRWSERDVRELARTKRKLVLVDGLLGIGATGNLRNPIKQLAVEINTLRTERGAYVVTIDMPTGLDAETGGADEDSVIADETLAVGFAKAGFVADAASNHVGRLTILSLPEFAIGARALTGVKTRGEVISAKTLVPLLPPRQHESNKGMYGRVGIVAGSVGATGAAIMCAHACARAGAGLITLLTHPGIYPIMAGAASPEVMVKPLPRPLDVLEMDFDVLGLGPGLSREHGSETCELIARWPKPMVVDADGLNALAEHMSSLASPAGARLLTPHPGEMKRLLHGSPELKQLAEDKQTPRAEIARRFTDHYPVTLLLKGARTIIAENGRSLAYNSTGNAGMATGGMGDVLTGICCALAGQKLSLYDAARYAAWLHGQAGDLALESGESVQSLLPMDLLAVMGRAFASVRWLVA